MVNKKGFIRTLEAVIAIILILGFIFYVSAKVVEFEEEVPENVANAKEFILNQILLNKEYRECIANVVREGKCGSVLGDNLLSNKKTCKESIIELMEYVPVGYGHACEICEGHDADTSTCMVPSPVPDDRSIYTNTIFIYKKTTSNYNFMRLYIWKN